MPSTVFQNEVTTFPPNCECPPIKDGELTFFCPRHNCLKTAHWRQLCQTRPDYFRLWEEGRGPGQAKPADWTPDQASRGLGDTIAKITTKLGIKPCGGCKKRQAALNKLVPYTNG